MPVPTYSVSRVIPFLPLAVQNGSSTAAFLALLDANGEQQGLKVYPTSTSPITKINIQVAVTGSMAGINFVLEVQSDNGDAPSGNVLGQATPEFTIASAGYIGDKTLAANTGNLTPNVPVWIVFRRSSGNNLSGTNYVGIRGGPGTGYAPHNPGRGRHYNGTNWTTSPAVAYRIGYICTHADGTITGLPYVGTVAAPAEALGVYGANRAGIKFRVGSSFRLSGLMLYLYKQGSPASLQIKAYQGSVLKDSLTIANSHVVSTVYTPYTFPNAVLFDPDSDIYIVLSQENDGGDSSNVCHVRCSNWLASLSDMMLPPNWGFVWGTGDDPTAFSFSNYEFPIMYPLITAPESDFEQISGGGAILSRMRTGY